jgi:hypothetical protein
MTAGTRSTPAIDWKDLPHAVAGENTVQGGNTVAAGRRRGRPQGDSSCHRFLRSAPGAKTSASARNAPLVMCWMCSCRKAGIYPMHCHDSTVEVGRPRSRAIADALPFQCLTAFVYFMCPQ